MEKNIEDIHTKDTSILIQPVAGNIGSVYFCREGLLNMIEGVEKTLYPIYS